MEQILNLTDLISVDTLQQIQDAFATMTGMASLTTDMHGTPVTKPSNFTDFCMNHVRNSKDGKARCEWCDKFGAETSWKGQGPAYYTCHAGLTDYAAPILADGQMIGSFIGGQVLTEPLKRENVLSIAQELDIDPELLWRASRKVRIISQQDIDHAADFLYKVSKVLSEMAYSKYMAIQAGKEIEKANNMKSDFLANMSHEIRTPMNAVVGMAEMALREDLPPAARDYVHQIKASSKALLTIINDILDFSKIESGKMDIIPDEYEPMSIINDVANIVMERLKDKEVELILDISPDIPNKLMGDNIRIKQVLLNIVNNAAKFTNIGQVCIRMSHRPIKEKEIMLRFEVEDTGIGIKKKDMETIFNSFQQLDSKRNRNIEGTGLGLTISRQLLQLMGGTIDIQSEYEKGSVFSFELPQTVIDDKPCCRVKQPSSIRAVGMFFNQYIKDQVAADCKKLGVDYVETISLEEAAPVEGKDNFLFVEQRMFTPTVEEYVKNTPNLTAVLLLPFRSLAEYDISNLLLVRKPLYVLNEAMIFNREGVHFADENADEVSVNFIAPEAEILIVDDNMINLTVAEGLLEPLKMKVTTVTSGKEAIGMISVHHYDLILMDHMMPELDGVETTRIIRRLHPEYNDVPIIALTANAVSGMKDMFLKEGMNDFVSKPIELKTLITKVGQWLPVEKIKKIEQYTITSVTSNYEEEIVVGNLDTAAAIKLLGNSKLFWVVLKDYYRVIEKKSALIKKLEEEEDWAAYTIEVHALKSSSKQIGAMVLSDKAAAMERAGNARNSKLIHEKTDDMLKQYRAYLPVLKPFCEDKEEKGGEEITKEVLESFFADMRTALEELDMDRMEEVSAAMAKYTYTGEQEEMFCHFKESVENVDVDTCEEIMKEWEKLL